MIILMPHSNLGAKSYNFPTFGIYTNLCYFFTTAIFLRDHFLPPVEENKLRINKKFVYDTNDIYDCEYTTTLRLVI